MSHLRQALMGYGSSMMLLVSIGGCAAYPAYDHTVRLSDDFSFFEPFDNSRDWGPNYLVGPPRPLMNRPTQGANQSTMQARPLPSIPSRPLPQLP